MVNSSPDHNDRVNRKQADILEVLGIMSGDYSELQELYGPDLDRVQGELRQLQANYVEGADELNDRVLGDIARFLEDNGSSLASIEVHAEAFIDLLENKAKEIDELREQYLVPQDFYNLSSYLDYGPEIMSDYYQAYLSCHEDCRLEISDISNCLREMDECLKDLEGCVEIDELPMRDRCMAEAFGYLINGDVVSFERKIEEFNLEIEYHKSQKAMEEKGKHLVKLMEYQERLDNINEESKSGWNLQRDLSVKLS